MFIFHPDLIVFFFELFALRTLDCIEINLKERDQYC
jgi:hypothetical protein